MVLRFGFYNHEYPYQREAGGASALQFTGSAPGCESDEAVARRLARELVWATRRRGHLSERRFIAEVARDCVMKKKGGGGDQEACLESPPARKALLDRQTITRAEGIRLIGPPTAERPIMERIRTLFAANRCKATDPKKTGIRPTTRPDTRSPRIFCRTACS
uniref:Uncharacterized protein n=1 Tax=Globodera rostochiensis TaxID=31243 RepID=A0A914GSD3_GLORO